MYLRYSNKKLYWGKEYQLKYLIINNYSTEHYLFNSSSTKGYSWICRISFWKKNLSSCVMVVHAFNPNTQKVEAGRVWVTSKTAKATQGNSVLKNPLPQITCQHGKIKHPLDALKLTLVSLQLQSWKSFIYDLTQWLNLRKYSVLKLLSTNFNFHQTNIFYSHYYCSVPMEILLFTVFLTLLIN